MKAAIGGGAFPLLATIFASFTFAFIVAAIARSTAASGSPTGYRNAMNRARELPASRPHSQSSLENFGLAVLATSCVALLWLSGR